MNKETVFPVSLCSDDLEVLNTLIIEGELTGQDIPDDLVEAVINSSN